MVVGTLKAIFSTAYAEGYIERDPSVALIRPKASRKEERRPLTPEETRNILEVAETHPDGLILGVLTAYLVAKHDKENLLDILDVLAPVIALGQAIGRWGNFFNEEAHGIETDLPWAQIIDGVGYHPTFLYESIWCFLLFVFLMVFSNTKRSFKGQIICLYFMLYSFERFFVEGLRTDSLMIGPLRQAQVISIVILIAAFIAYQFLRKKYPLDRRPAESQ